MRFVGLGTWASSIGHRRYNKVRSLRWCRSPLILTLSVCFEDDAPYGDLTIEKLGICASSDTIQFDAPIPIVLVFV